jgi:hypothetical protein
MGLTRIRADQISNIDYKQAVKVITLTNISNLSNGAPLIVDGVTLSVGDRVLVSAQATGSQNGIYVVQSTGTGNNGAWIRSSDANATGDLEGGTILMVTDGASYADTSWKLITDDPIVIGVSTLTFLQNTGNSFNIISTAASNVAANGVSGTVTFTAGNNFSVVGNNASDVITFSVVDAPTFVGNVTGNYFIGNGSQLTGLPATYANANVQSYLASNANVVITTTGNISTTANISGAYILGNGSQLTGLPAGYSNADVATYLASNSNVTITTTGNITTTANITGNYILGNGALLTGVITSVANINNGTSNVTVVSAGGNVTVGIGGTANVAVFATTGEYVTGIISASGNIISGANIAAGNLSTSGNIVGGGVRSTSSSTAPVDPAVGDFWYNTTTNVQYRFTFDGTSYYWIDDFGSTAGVNGTFNQVVNGTSNISINTANSNITISVSGVGNVAGFTTAGQYVNGIISATGNVYTANIIATGNIIPSANNVYSLGSPTAQWASVYVGNATLYLGNTAISANNVSNTLIVNGNTVVTANPSGTSSTTGNVAITGNVTGGNVLTANIVSAGGNITGNYFIGNGSQLTGIFPSGTRLLFQQTAAPTGWTKDTAYNNYALRITSGNVTTGGSVGFTTAFASQAVSGTVGTSGSTTATGSVGDTGSTTVSGTVNGTTLSAAQVPNQTGFIAAHGSTNGSLWWQPSGAFSGSPTVGVYRIPGTTDAGASSIQSINLNLGFGDGSHNHSFSGAGHTHTSGAFTGVSHTHTSGAFTGTAINLAVQYVDAIICSKN